MLDSLAHAWLTLQCQMMPRARRALVALRSMDESKLEPTASWPSAQSASAALADAGRLALANGTAVFCNADAGGDAGSGVIVACPLTHDGVSCGVVAVELESLPDNARQAVVQLLQWGSSWLGFVLREQSVALASRFATVLEVTATALEQPRFPAAANAIVNQLSRKFDCERVSLGFVERGRLRVYCLSHTAELEHRANLVRDIEAAMQEALDESAPVSCSAAEAEAQPHSAHAQLLHRQAAAAACSLPLSAHGEAIGAVTFERLRGSAFDDAQLELADAVAALLGPALELARREDRPMLTMLRERAARALATLLGPRRMKRKLVAAGLLALTLVLALATGEYRIAATATLEGTVHRALVAPVDSFIEVAHARAGDVVRAGDVLAELDDEELVLEHRRWASEHDELVKQRRRAVAELDRSGARILEAQIGKARAQVELVEQQLARTRITAPIDGVVVTGDLSHSLGAPVERGQVLFELAPLDGYRLALQVPESEIADVAPGQRGKLALAALPGEPLSFVVEQIIGLAQSEDGRNVFRVEAQLDQATTLLRPGMKGVGKLYVERRRLLWIWSHGLLERVRLWLWLYLP